MTIGIINITILTMVNFRDVGSMAQPLRFLCGACGRNKCRNLSINQMIRYRNMARSPRIFWIVDILFLSESRSALFVIVSSFVGADTIYSFYVLKSGNISRLGLPTNIPSKHNNTNIGNLYPINKERSCELSQDL